MGPRGRQWVRILRKTAGYELVACADIRAESLLGTAAALAIPESQCYLNLDEALDHTQPQAVVVATSMSSHTDPCLTAVARGLGVLVEKPLALNLAEARRMVAAAGKVNAPLLVGQTYRYTGMSQTIRQFLGTGALGRIGMIVYQVYRGNDNLPPSLASMPNSIIWETGVHHIDLLRYVFGQEFVGVKAESFVLPWSRLAAGASTQVLFELDRGTRGFYSATYDTHQESSLRIVGERGIVHPWRRWLVLTRPRRVPQIVGRAPHLEPEVALLDQLKRAVLAGEPPECSGQDNLNTIAVLEACARSAAEQRRINPQDLFHESP